MKKLSIVLVTWNSEDDIIECLSSIFNVFPSSADVGLEVIIVDNNSADTTLNLIENYKRLYDYDIKLFRNNENLGFTRGCNQALSESSGDYILILNPDTEILPDAFGKLIGYLDEHDETGAVAPQLVTRKNKVQYSCRTFPRYRDMFFEILLLSSVFPKSRFFSRWKMRYFNHNETRQVDQPMGAALMLKKKVFESVGKLDDRFTMFFNDVDFCKRVYDKGFNIIFLHDAKIKHAEGTSVFKDRAAMINHWNNDCLKYFKKHYYKQFSYVLLFMGLKISGIVRIIFAKIFH